jgi:hypothetical protein
MTDRHYNGLSDFAKRAPQDVGKIARGLSLLVQEEAFLIARPYSRAITPVGGTRGRDRHVGLLKSSWTERGAPGGMMILNNRASYSNIIDRGRKRGVTPRGQKRTSHKKGKPHPEARMLGSVQARAGLRRPTVKYVMGAREAIVRKAITRLEAQP